MKIYNKLVLIGALIIQIGALNAQAPTITAIDYRVNYPNEIMVINGLNYNADPTKMKVLFGGVEGNVLYSDATTIEVEIPGNARFSNIHIINTTNGLSVISEKSFYPSHKGSNFDINNMEDPILYELFEQQLDVCTCDLDGDGLRDMITTIASNNPNIIVYRNTTTDPNNIQFDPIVIPVAVSSRNIICNDINGDGKSEIIFGRNDVGNRNFVYILPNNSSVGNFNFGSKYQMKLATGDLAIKMAVNDLDFDGRPEIVISNSQRNEISIFKNLSSGGTITMSSTPIQIVVAGATTTAGLEVQDMDGDSKPEIIVTQFLDRNIYVLKNRSGVGSISFDNAFMIDVPKSIIGLKVGDLDQDGDPDIGVTHTFDNNISIYKNISTTSALGFELSDVWPADTDPWGIDMGDLDGDGKLEVIVSNNNFPTINIYKNNSTSTSIILSPWTKLLPARAINTRVADMNNDDKPDIMYTSAEPVNGIYHHLGLIRNTNCFIPEVIGDATRFLCDQPIPLESIHNNGAIFNWYKDDVLIQGPAHGVNTANSSKFEANAIGNYKLIVEAEGGACNITSNVIVVEQAAGSVPGAPTAVNDSPTCEGDNVTLNVEFAGAPPAGLTFEWTGPNGFTSTEMSPVIPNVSPINVGNYVLKVASGQCETNEVSTIVEVNSLPEFSVTASSDVAFCTGGTIVLSVNNTGGYGYEWLLNGSPTGETGLTYTSANAGKYSVQVTDQSTFCTKTTNEVELFIFTTPVASITLPSTLCLDEEVQFTAASSVTDPTATVSYLWDFGNGETATVEDPLVSFITSGAHTVSLTVNYDEANCPSSSTETITIVVPELLELLSSSDGVCGTDDVELSTNITLANSLWNTTEATPTILINAPGTYTVEGNDVNGCLVNAGITLVEKEVPRIVITATPESIVDGDVVDLLVEGADSYLWSPAESLDDPEIANPKATPNITTTYKVRGTIVDGCTALDSITIQVRPAISTAYRVLNLSSTNQVITIENKGEASVCSLSIFDRYGTKVFEGEGNAVDWDGTGFNGELPQDTYFYVFKCENAEPTTGSILLIRS